MEQIEQNQICQKLEVLSIPEALRESIANLSEKLAIEKKHRMELEKDNERLRQKLLQITTLFEEAKKQTWEMYKILERK